MFKNMKGEDSFKTMIQNDPSLRDFAKIQQGFVRKRIIIE
jgi:hypothetical protein